MFRHHDTEGHDLNSICTAAFIRIPYHTVQEHQTLGKHFCTPNYHRNMRTIVLTFYQSEVALDLHHTFGRFHCKLMFTVKSVMTHFSNISDICVSFIKLALQVL